MLTMSINYVILNSRVENYVKCSIININLDYITHKLFERINYNQFMTVNFENRYFAMKFLRLLPIFNFTLATVCLRRFQYHNISCFYVIHVKMPLAWMPASVSLCVYFENLYRIDVENWLHILLSEIIFLPRSPSWPSFIDIPSVNMRIIVDHPYSILVYLMFGWYQFDPG